MKAHSRRYSGHRYTSSGVIAVIPPGIQAALWRMIGEKREAGEELDRLQMFELSTRKTDTGTTVQLIVQRQESPAFVDAMVVGDPKPYDGSVYVVEDENGSAMMLQEEY